MPGHEVIGTIDAIGPEVHGWTVGERAGVGWHGGNCGYCKLNDVKSMNEVYPLS